MKVVFRIFIVVLFLWSSDAFLTNADRRALAANYLTSTCGCRNYHYLCPFVYNRCTEDRIRLLCPLTCALCVECPAEIDPTLGPSPTPCEFDCEDISPPVLCAWFKTRLFCPYVGSMCRETCEECNRCIVPPITPPPCREICNNIVEEENCIFWREQGFCDPEGDYPSVPYLCERTCGFCRSCELEIV